MSKYVEVSLKRRFLNTYNKNYTFVIFGVDLLVQYMFIPDSLPDAMPPFRDIQHVIDLVSESQLPNHLYCRRNPVEKIELNR